MLHAKAFRTGADFFHQYVLARFVLREENPLSQGNFVELQVIDNPTKEAKKPDENQFLKK